MNFIAVLVAAIVPLIVGFIWYNPKVFGTAWMRSIGVNNPDEMKAGPGMALVFGLSLLFSIMLSMSMVPMVIHQMGLMSLLQGMPEAKDAKIELLVNGQAIEYAGLFRTFGHGALHGFIGSLFIIVPVMSTNALYERRGFRYVAINGGYWMVSMMLMGGIICAWQ